MNAAPASAAEATIVGSDRTDAITGSYIVTLNKSVARADVPRVARELAGRHSGPLGHTYTKARQLAADPAVARVETDGIAQVTGMQPNPTWGLDRVDQRDLPLDRYYTYPSPAANVTAYVVDTGIRTSHQDFGGRAASGYDFVDNDSDAADCHGHGTHVTGTVGSAYGVAKGGQARSRAGPELRRNRPIVDRDQRYRLGDAERGEARGRQHEHRRGQEPVPQRRRGQLHRLRCDVGCGGREQRRRRLLLR
ncbi:S8 family serine peptidase [Streptomyces sp. NPDC096205]|uniref:S8 family serine peptidase n=1 Tax=Streptomyces sp. NPDC096205 TaxID=3366081 RepID=UPI0037F281C3